jgi:hypothetical protein
MGDVMRTLRLCLAGTVILLLLGGLGGTVLAQEDEENGGFTLKFVEGTDTWEDGTRQREEGFDEVTGRTWTTVIDASDPRLSGTWTYVTNCREFGVPGSVVCVGSVRVENEGGTWLGTTQQSGASLYPAPHWAWWTVLEGQGDYAGLTAISDYDEEKMGEGDIIRKLGEGDIDGVGSIFDFGMPPMPDPIEPSTE